MLAKLWESIQRLFSGSSANAVITYTTKTSAAQQGILNMPPKIRLKPTSEIAWRDPRQAETYQKFLAAENLASTPPGFVPTGRSRLFRGPVLPGLRSRNPLAKVSGHSGKPVVREIIWSHHMAPSPRLEGEAVLYLSRATKN